MHENSSSIMLYWAYDNAHALYFLYLQILDLLEVSEQERVQLVLRVDPTLMQLLSSSVADLNQPTTARKLISGACELKHLQQLQQQFSSLSDCYIICYCSYVLMLLSFSLYTEP